MHNNSPRVPVVSIVIDFSKWIASVLTRVLKTLHGLLWSLLHLLNLLSLLRSLSSHRLLRNVTLLLRNVLLLLRNVLLLLTLWTLLLNWRSRFRTRISWHLGLSVSGSWSLLKSILESWLRSSSLSRHAGGTSLTIAVARLCLLRLSSLWPTHLRLSSLLRDTSTWLGSCTSLHALLVLLLLSSELRLPVEVAWSLTASHTRLLGHSSALVGGLGLATRRSVSTGHRSLLLLRSVHSVTSLVSSQS